MDSTNPKELLKQAIECDEERRYMEAQYLYTTAVKLLKVSLIGELDPTKRRVYESRMKDYSNRAECIQRNLSKASSHGKQVTTIKIEEDSTNNSYSTLFSKYIDDTVKEVRIEEPHLSDRFQINNFIIFLELLFKFSNNIKFIYLVTKEECKPGSQRTDALAQLKADLITRGATMGVLFETKLHDRKIILSNGYIFKIGRGLHYFKQKSSVYALGIADYDFRKCHQTEVDIWCTKN